jgi:DNA-binding GntR family transcriptional regulator
MGPLNVPTTSEAAAQAIRDAVLTGALKPGERLIEEKLAHSLGIGQPTLREALKELEYQGFVRTSRKRGTYVLSFTQDDLRKILEVRIVLEALAIECATLRVSLGSGVEPIQSKRQASTRKLLEDFGTTVDYARLRTMLTSLQGRSIPHLARPIRWPLIVSRP